MLARFFQEQFALAEACATIAVHVSAMKDLWDQIVPESVAGVPSHLALRMVSAWPVDLVCAIMVAPVKIANFIARLEKMG